MKVKKHNAINAFGSLLDFLDQLEEAHIRYALKHVRETIMVLVSIPQGYWEIEFFENGEIEVELFRRKGVKLVRKKWLKRFIKENS